MGENERDFLDLTSDEPINGIEKRIEVKDYDPRPQEDSARRNIAYILLSILGVILIWSLLSITLNRESTDDVISVLQIILSPIIALVSAATGFYYGSKSN